MKQEPVENHYFCFNPKDNGGESLSLRTEYFLNGTTEVDSDAIFTNQFLSLQSYCNSATFELIGASITSKILRKLADELDVKEAQLRAKYPNLYK
jgi:gamma-glutamyl phosphate reductase